MEIVKTTEEYQIIKKRNGRFGVRRTNRQWVTGEDKLNILVAEGLVKAPAPKPAEEPAEEAESSEDASDEAEASEES